MGIEWGVEWSKSIVNNRVVGGRGRVRYWKKGVYGVVGCCIGL